MTAEWVLRILREGLLLILLLSAGPMLASLLTGLLTGLLQATTQIQEQTLSAAPKLAAVFLTLAIMGPWMLQQMMRFTHALFEAIPMMR